MLNISSYDEFINEMRTKAYENNDDITLDFPKIFLLK